MGTTLRPRPIKSRNAALAALQRLRRYTALYGAACHRAGRKADTASIELCHAYGLGINQWMDELQTYLQDERFKK